MSLRTPHLNALIVSLAAIYAVIVAGFGVVSFFASPSEPTAAMHAGEAAKVLAAAPSGPVDVSVLRARPLFAASRRPRSIEPTAEPLPAEMLPLTAGFEDLNIVAVAIKGEEAIATLESSSGQKARLRVGSNLRGWRVKTIERTGITLESGSEERRIDMRRSSSFAPGEPVHMGDGDEFPDPMP